MALDESGMLPVQQSRQIFVSESKVETVSDEDVPKGDMRHENQQKISVLEKLYPVHLQHPQRIDVTSNRIVGPADSGRISENYGEDLSKYSVNNPSHAHGEHQSIFCHCLRVCVCERRHGSKQEKKNLLSTFCIC